MAESILDRLASKSNAGQDSFSGPKIPTIKVDGSGSGPTAGHILKFANDEMIDIGNKLNIQIIRVRKKLWQGGELTKYFSEEYDSSANDVITLRMSTRATDKDAWSKPVEVAKGTAQEIRQTNEVKVVSVVYGIVDKELVKLTVKGASCTGSDGLYDYLDSFKPQLALQFETNVSVSLVQKNRAISYHRMHFTRGTEITEGFETVEAYLDMIGGSKTEATQVVAPNDTSLDDF